MYFQISKISVSFYTRRPYNVNIWGIVFLPVIADTILTRTRSFLWWFPCLQNVSLSSIIRIEKIDSKNRWDKGKEIWSVQIVVVCLFTISHITGYQIMRKFVKNFFISWGVLSFFSTLFLSVPYLQIMFIFPIKYSMCNWCHLI